MVKTRKNQKKQRGGFFGFFNKPEPQPSVVEQNTNATVVTVPTKTPEQLAWQQQQAELKRKFAEQRLAEPAQDNNAQTASYITRHAKLSNELKADKRREFAQQRPNTPPNNMGGKRKSKRKSRKSRKSIKKSKNNKR